MESSPMVCDAPPHGFRAAPDSAPSSALVDSARPETLRVQTHAAVSLACKWLLAQQQPAGCWEGELEGDTILESEYVLLLAYLGRHQTVIARKAARYLIERQLPDGGWSQYPGGAVDPSGSVKAYFALKLTGHDASAEYMQRARSAILAHGGADGVNSFTRFYLALLGQIAYDQCPAVPPEALLLPNRFPINIYKVSAWSRTILVPLSIMWACRPVAPIEPRLGIRELFLRSPADWPELRCPGLKGATGPLSWDRFFRRIDRAWKVCERWGLLPLRRRALAAAERWMVERFQQSDGLGAIFPPMVWSVIALRSLGYADDSPEMKYCLERLEGLYIEEGETLRLQPCKSPVWDTAIAVRALTSSGVSPDDPAIARAITWLLDHEVRRRGDWAETVTVEPGGWYFEHANEFYPDVDDTAMVLMTLARQYAAGCDGRPTSEAGDAATIARTTAAIARGERWMLALQNRDGGWGAFDRDNDREFLCYVPFADHNAMIDPSTPDLAGRVLESLGCLGRRRGDSVVERAIDYLRRSQQADGSWFGRWGVNYIYGTWQVLTGLAAVGMPADDPLMASGANWLLAYQQPAGGWGESADSYANPHLRGQGTTTASQTAWAVLGLLAAGMRRHPATERGVCYLLEQQRDDGTWDEAEFTGTGFPLVFYLRYHLYRIYFPLLALSRWAAATNDH